jgi:hypothetical protein
MRLVVAWTASQPFYENLRFRILQIDEDSEANRTTAIADAPGRRECSRSADQSRYVGTNSTKTNRLDHVL